MKVESTLRDSEQLVNCTEPAKRGDSIKPSMKPGRVKTRLHSFWGVAERNPRFVEVISEKPTKWATALDDS